MAAVHHFTSGQGETFSTVVTWDIDGELVDLTGYSARMQLRKKYSSAEAAISLDEASGLELGGVAGTIDVVIEAATSSAVPAIKYVYDLELESAGGVVKRLLEGTFTLTPEVSK